MTAPSPAIVNKRIGPIVLAPGVQPIQILFYIVATMACTFATAFASLMQPVLLNQQLHVPVGQQGTLTGALGFTQQGAVLLLIGVAGVLADRLGRRIILMMALMGFMACLWVYPFVSSVAALFVIRFFWGMFSTGHTAGGATMLMDYPEERSRGKFISLIAIVYAGLIFGYNLKFASHLTSWLRSAGLDSNQAIRGAFWIISAICLLGLFTAFFFLKKDRPSRAADHATPHPRTNLLKAWKHIFAHARTNPRFAAVMLIATVVRTDSAILTSFLGLWVIQAARHHGIDPIEATKTVGFLLAVGNITTLAASPFFGWLSDRIDRLTMLITALGVVGVAFCCFGLISDVFSPWMVAVVFLVSLAEGGQQLAANALLGEAAPPELRGAALGIFTWVGVVSVLAINLLAGVVFDKAGQSAPFVMEGVLCLAVFLAALRLVWRQRQTERAKAEAIA
jgi:MFS family permease